MKNQQTIVSEQEHRVLKFRPRTMAHPPPRHLGEQDASEDAGRGVPNDLARFEQARDDPDAPVTETAGGFDALRRDAHAGQRRRICLYRCTDRGRNMARHEHRGSSQHPGLRADGPAGLRAYFHAAFLGFQARAGPFGAKMRPAPFRPAPLNSGRRSDIRALNFGRGIGHSGTLRLRRVPF